MFSMPPFNLLQSDFLWIFSGHIIGGFPCCKELTSMSNIQTKEQLLVVICMHAFGGASKTASEIKLDKGDELKKLA